METIKIKYFNDKLEKLTYIDGKSDWIDLRAAEDVDLKQGEFKLIPLGVAMQLPKGYEAHIVPRSSTFKNFGIIQTNHQGVVDCSYCGDNDQWFMPVLAVRDTHISFNDRICQFRIMENQPKIAFDEVVSLSSTVIHYLRGTVEYRDRKQLWKHWKAVDASSFGNTDGIHKRHFCMALNGYA